MNSILKHFLISTCYNDGGEEKHGKQILFAHKKIFSSTFILKVQEVVKQIPLPEKRKKKIVGEMIRPRSEAINDV